MNAKERVNRNPVNPQYGVQVEGNPAFSLGDMVNVPLWHDYAATGERRLFLPIHFMAVTDSGEKLDLGKATGCTSTPAR